MQEGRLTQESFAKKVYSKTLDDRLHSAIQITTAAGVCATVDLVREGALPDRGFVRQEDAVLADFLATKAGARLVGEARGVDAAGLAPTVAIKSAA